MRLSLLLPLFVIALTSAQAATYTVGPSGCDYTSFSSAFSGVDFAAGDILEARAATPGGSVTFNETVDPGANDSGGSGNPVIIRARSGDTVTIDGQDTRNYGVNLSSVNYVTVSGFVIDNCQYAGIYAQGASITGITAASNTINISITGAATGTRNGIAFLGSVDGTSCIIDAIAENNTITSDTGQYDASDTDGIKIPNSSGAIIRGNTITININVKNTGDNHSDGIQMWNAANMQVYANRISMPYAVDYNQGIYLEFYNRGSSGSPTDYGNCLCYNNVISGYFGSVGLSLDAKEGSFTTAAVIDAEFYNNTVNADGGLPFIAENCATIILQNNLFIRETAGIVYGIYNSEGTQSTTITANYNFIYPEPSTTAGTDVVEISPGAEPARNFMTWAETLTAGYEANGIGYSSGWIDPSLNGSFAPDNAADPAVGAGIDLSSEFTTDITGATRTTWDIGAYFYDGGGGGGGSLNIPNVTITGTLTVGAP